MKNIVLLVLGVFAGTFVKNVVDEEPLDFVEAAVGAAFNIISSTFLKSTWDINSIRVSQFMHGYYHLMKLI